MTANVISSGIVHFQGAEWAETGTVPNVYFGHGQPTFDLEPVVRQEAGSIFISVALALREKYAGILPLAIDGRDHRIIFVMERVADVMGVPIFQVAFTITVA